MEYIQNGLLVIILIMIVAYYAIVSATVLHFAVREAIKMLKK